MHCKDFFVDNCCNRQAIEAVGERLPELYIIPPLTFVIESIYAIDRRALMVPTQDEEIFWVLDLVRKKQANCFKGLLAPVDIVSEEEVVCFGRKSSVFEKAEEVVILAMNITTDLRQTK